MRHYILLIMLAACDSGSFTIVGGVTTLSESTTHPTMHDTVDAEMHDTVDAEMHDTVDAEPDTDQSSLPDPTDTDTDTGSAIVEDTDTDVPVEIPANGIDDDGDGFDVCYKDEDNDGYGSVPETHICDATNPEPTPQLRPVVLFPGNERYPCMHPANARDPYNSEWGMWYGVSQNANDPDDCDSTVPAN